MSNAYQEFALIYDHLMQEIPYAKYIDFLIEALGDLKGRSILDVGCGTGTLALALAKKGAKVTGIDLSHEMIEIAIKRAEDAHLLIEWKQQNMMDMMSDHLFDAVVITIDSLNYLQDEAALRQTLRHVYDVLTPGGILLFDVHSLYKMAVLLEEAPFTYDDGEVTYLWETTEGNAPFSVRSRLIFFVQEDQQRYRRFEELHEQRTFPIPEYVNFLMEAGFSVERVFADWDGEAPSEESERIFFQVRK